MYHKNGYYARNFVSDLLNVNVELLSRYITFSLNRRGSQNPHDLLDFLRRSGWKIRQMPGRRKILANFLIVLDTSQ